MLVIEKLRVYSLYDFMIKTVSEYKFFDGQRERIYDDKMISQIFVCFVNNFEIDD